ncbi:MAG TPA: hypothetical protein VEO36_08880 [Casimicrobiaceae bacterium]|nr:hypothetical protein [Casimicrobiaceae bacterium]
MDRFALFPTPLFVYDVPNVEDMNCQLGECLRAEAQACVWPTWPKYIGGDTNAAASFTCVNDDAALR